MYFLKDLYFSVLKCAKKFVFLCFEVTMEFFYTCEGSPITVLIQELWSAGLFRTAKDIESRVMGTIKS